jgi:hypothetical protein
MDKNINKWQIDDTKINTKMAQQKTNRGQKLCFNND